MALARRYSRQDDFEVEIAAASQRYGVEPALIKAVIARESAFNPMAHNPNDPGGAWGLMQVIEGTARWLGHRGEMSELFTPSVGIALGTKYLGLQRLKYPAIADTVASYNAGSPRHTASGAYINQPYVTGVLDLLAYFRAYDAERGGGGVEPSPFLGSDNPDGPRGPVDVVADPETPVGPAPSEPAPGDPETPVGPSPAKPPRMPRMRWPVVGIIAGAGLWAALYFATCGG